MRHCPQPTNSHQELAKRHLKSDRIKGHLIASSTPSAIVGASAIVSATPDGRDVTSSINQAVTDCRLVEPWLE
jgi:hypothetical protein